MVGSLWGGFLEEVSLDPGLKGVKVACKWGKNYKHLYSTCCMPDIILKALHIFSHLIFTTL